MPSEPVHDLVGIGFGPSNLALAIAVHEHERPVTARFFEKQPAFGWHRGMLLEDATMQVSFLKDLVTLRNPRSEFSFLCYLRDRGRLIDFVNHKNLFPLRVEFHDYFEWAAEKVAHLVSYGTEVVQVTSDGDVFEVTTNDGQVTVARNLVMATGLEPNLPEGIETGERIWHNRELLHRVEQVNDPQRFVVVGAGQSAAEVTAFLHDRFPAAEVCGVFARYGYSPADDSSFANRIFDPAAVDDFYSAPEDVKRKLMAYHGNTNFAVVDLDLIQELYRRVYREKVLNRQRLRLYNTSRLVDVADDGAKVSATVESLADGSRRNVEADVVVYSTGYRPANPVRLLGSLAEHCRRDADTRLKIDRDYRVVTSPDLRCGIYLQGGTEHTHGITSSLLSNTAVRVGEILGSILDHGAAVTVPQSRIAVSVG
ncbi:lysine N(6)-hydroxylase/L-ornithine N(5)-oxygenase family protein [Lentzea tibetensis]|uniref:L-lysine N6-monooxygenase MbtG n=1 Tax=Lentzea tibetensis TaxID=2591470 RepID=A0A563EJU2_9PSEU|nr:lysine N(6)-hydroxylase/L-ornithine N(5)-oxygenase family protein [Lentzea tibetensis]TWP47310.1 lysine N(6)-hydroxylase/L-ornithine N(5)-oxygenase family protein [Lentzea tibetensis]